MVRVGLIGCGTIGERLAVAVERRYPRAARITALHDIDPVNTRRLQQRLRARPPMVSFPELIRRSDVVLEAASAQIAPRAAAEALRRGRHVLVMSVGGLLQDDGWRRWLGRTRARLYIPSGALAGVDGLKAMAVGTVRRAVLTTSKPPRALMGAPYVRRRGLRLERLSKPKRIFEGSPRDVVRAFPQNTNVAAALTLALAQRDGSVLGRAMRLVRVRVIADPALRLNRHEIDVVGDAGRLQCRVESRPSRNPKTSELAVRSAIATLGRLFDSLMVGT